MELIEAARKFLEIDDKIHSRSENVNSQEIIDDANTYTDARKNLILAIRAASQHTTPADGNSLPPQCPACYADMQVMWICKKCGHTSRR